MNHEIKEGCYLKVTSAGAYYCMTSSEPDLARNVIANLLSEKKTLLLTDEKIDEWFGENREQGYSVLHHLQKLNWLTASEEELTCSSLKLEQILPTILGDLSSQNKVLLADSHGFYLSSVGFPHESAEEISALSADLISMHERHKGVLNGNLKMSSSNWGMIDSAGHNQLGFWPLHVGRETFSLVIGNRPILEHQSFVTLAWILHTRYASKLS